MHTFEINDECWLDFLPVGEVDTRTSTVPPEGSITPLPPIIITHTSRASPSLTVYVSSVNATSITVTRKNGGELYQSKH